jgi:pantoate--beta-alanine ligase
VTPLLIRDREALAVALNDLPSPRGVVMTMGALHAGHLDLVRAAAARGGTVIVTVFVNPLQFGPDEDFAAYPRTLDDDLRVLGELSPAVVYAPSAADMYPSGAPAVRLDPGDLGNVYEGAIRPGHFAGVLTVVAKLLARTRAEVAYFGRKDAQQLALVRQMVRDLDLPLEIVAVPIRRDPDGLALSSRNRYLSPEQRVQALALPRALDAAVALAADGAPPAAMRRAALAVLTAAPRVEVDYFDVVDATTFRRVGARAAGEGLAIGAIRVGGTRLIDNASVSLGGR